MKEVEYRVRPVTRYVVTRWYNEDHEDGRSHCGSEPLGEFDNESQALKVMMALAERECAESEVALPLGQDGKSIRWTEGDDPGFA